MFQRAQPRPKRRRRIEFPAAFQREGIRGRRYLASGWARGRASKRRSFPKPGSLAGRGWKFRGQTSWPRPAQLYVSSSCRINISDYLLLSKWRLRLRPGRCQHFAGITKREKIPACSPEYRGEFRTSPPTPTTNCSIWQAPRQKRNTRKMLTRRKDNRFQESVKAFF